MVQTMRNLAARLTLVALLAISLLISLLILVASANADEKSSSDPDDPGSQMALDLADITHRHEQLGRSRLLGHVVRFYDPVESSALYQGAGGLQLIFNTDRDSIRERLLKFSPNPDGSLTAAIYTRSGRVEGFVNWWRPDESSVAFSFRKALLKRRLTRYQWQATTAQDSPCDPSPPEGPVGDRCFDETDWLSHVVAST